MTDVDPDGLWRWGSALAAVRFATERRVYQVNVTMKIPFSLNAKGISQTAHHVIIGLTYYQWMIVRLYQPRTRSPMSGMSTVSAPSPTDVTILTR